MVLADAKLAERIFEMDRAYWRALGPAALAAGVVESDPFLDAGGSVAFFAGDESPITQANGEFSAEDLAAISTFYRGRTSSWEAVIRPFAHRHALETLIAAGGTVENWESLMVRSLDDLQASELPPELTIVRVEPEQTAKWVEVSTAGFFGEKPSQVALNLGKILARTAHPKYLAFWNGEPAAAAGLHVIGDLAYLGEMSTLPQFRGRGIQRALIERRLADASATAKLALLGAWTGNTSHRNAERCGFRVAWTQLSVRVPASR